MLKHTSVCDKALHVVVLKGWHALISSHSLCAQGKRRVSCVRLRGRRLRSCCWIWKLQSETD